MGRQKCTIKWQNKCLPLNCKTKVYRSIARKKCTFKWQGKSVRLDDKTKVYI